VVRPRDNLRVLDGLPAQRIHHDPVDGAVHGSGGLPESEPRANEDDRTKAHWLRPYNNLMYPAYNPQLTGGRVPWPDSARLAANAGFPGVDIGLTSAIKNGLAATRQLLDELKLRPAVVDLPVDFRKLDFPKGEETFRNGLRLLPDAASFSAAIGCPRMTTYLMSSSEKPKAELRKIYLDRFQACAEVLARSHVRLGFEFLGPLHIRKTYPYEFIWRMDEMLAFAKECGPNCGVLLDSWHWYHAGATMGDIIAAGKDGIVHVQINDSAKMPPEQVKDNERLLPGEGVIDLKGFLQALRKIGYTDGLSVEVFGRGLKEMPPEEGAKLGFEYASRVMRGAGII
jgi:sugar phosphate isomerase/epimerase